MFCCSRPLIGFGNLINFLREQFGIYIYMEYGYSDHDVFAREMSLTSVDRDVLSIGLDYDLYAWIKDSYVLCTAIRDSVGPLFYARLINEGIDEYLLTVTKLGRKVLEWIQRGSLYSVLLRDFPQECHTLELNPHFRVMTELLYAVEPAEASTIARSGKLTRCGSHIKRLNEAVTTCRALQSAAGFLRELRYRKSHERTTERSLLRYILRLHDLHAKLLVVRIDLHYRHDPATNKIGPRPSVERVMHDRDELVKMVRRWAKGNMVGYAIRSEFAFYKGPHHHAIFIFNGHRLRSDIRIGNMVGQMWNEAVTKGQGSHFVCNRYKFRYLSCGIGLVDYRNQSDREGADKMVKYLAKPPEFGVLWAAGRRTLVKGEISRTLGSVRRGRPRAA